MGLKYISASGGPECFALSGVQVIDGERHIPYVGALSAVLVPTDSDEGCQLIGMIFDDQRTLIVDCLHSEAAVHAFRAACKANGIARVVEVTRSIAAPCPPPTNLAQVQDWSMKLFHELRPS
jgi:hypothetical protein